MVLNEVELRVLGALVEKQISTPDYYPMTLNALVNACNQKNHRDPVVSYNELQVSRALETLRDKKLTYMFHGSESRVEKYGHAFPKVFSLDEAETAILCVLILRGPQTPGELRSRTSHLRDFENLSDVDAVLHKLSTREEPFVIKLPRQPGSRESRFAHLLGGEINVEEMAAAATHKRSDAERITRLEEDVQALRQELVELKQRFDGFSKQFE